MDLFCVSTLVVVAVLKKNFAGLCCCLPQDYMVTIKRLKRSSSVPDDLPFHLAGLSSTDIRNRTIISLMIRSLDSDIEALGICDILEDVVDSSTSKKVIQNLRCGMIHIHLIVL